MACRARAAAATLLADLTTPPASSADADDTAAAHAYHARRRGVGDAPGVRDGVTAETAPELGSPTLRLERRWLSK